MAAVRVGSNTGSKTAEDPQAQMAVANAQALVDTLKLKLLANFDVLMNDARDDKQTDINQRIQYRFEASTVPEECLQAALELQKMLGGRAIFTSSTLQRIVLDILAGRAHVANNPYQFGRNFGAVQLGLENGDFFL